MRKTVITPPGHLAAGGQLLFDVDEQRRKNLNKSNLRRESWKKLQKPIEPLGWKKKD